MGLVQQDRGPHGMAEPEPRFGRERPENLRFQRGEIEMKEVETLDVAAAGTGNLAVRLALAPPIQDDGIEVAGPQIVDGLEIALDEFAAPRSDHDGAAALARRRPSRDAQGQAVLGAHRRDDRIRRNRVSRRGEKVDLHDFLFPVSACLNPKAYSCLKHILGRKSHRLRNRAMRVMPGKRAIRVT